MTARFLHSVGLSGKILNYVKLMNINPREIVNPYKYKKIADFLLENKEDDK